MSATIQTRTETAPSSAMAAARKAMIDSQLRTSGVNTPFVLARMGTVPREDYVPAELASVAYTDRAISVGEGARLAAPLFYGKMLEEAAPTPNDTVLIVSAAPEYLTALIEPLVGKVDTITPAQGMAGAKLKGPYSLLLIDGAVEHVPARLAKALADDGRAVLGLSENSVTRIASGRRSGDKLALLPLAELGVPKLGAFDAPREWQF